MNVWSELSDYLLYTFSYPNNDPDDVRVTSSPKMILLNWDMNNWKKKGQL